MPAVRPQKIRWARGHVALPEPKLMPRIPLAIVEFIFRLPFFLRPRFLAEVISERPTAEDLRADLVFLEVRGGHVKWLHMTCPRCADHIQLPLAGKDQWSVKVDLLRRPTIVPSIWEKTSCGAHFIVRKGTLRWCE